MKLNIKYLTTAIIMLAVVLLTACTNLDFELTPTENTKVASAEGVDTNYDVVVEFSEDEYPETAKHIEDAIANGASPYCTIDREGADDNRDDSLRGIPTKEGYDRDEFPMAMCEEGGEGADIEYITPSDNRGAGSWFGHQVSDYPDGTTILINVN